MAGKTSPAALPATFGKVRRASASLPGVEEQLSYGTLALKLKGKLLARLKEDGTTLVLRTDFGSRDAMLRLQPEIFHLTDHYRDYPYILVHLRRIPVPRLRELLQEAWRTVAPKRLLTAAPKPARPRRR